MMPVVRTCQYRRFLYQQPLWRVGIHYGVATGQLQIYEHISFLPTSQQKEELTSYSIAVKDRTTTEQNRLNTYSIAVKDTSADDITEEMAILTSRQVKEGKVREKDTHCITHIWVVISLCV
jgi:hypothetical protein